MNLFLATLEDSSLQMPTPSYLTILLYSGPLGIFLHLLTFLSIFALLRLVWKRASPALLFLVAILPLTFAAMIMQIGVRGILVLQESGTPTIDGDIKPVAEGMERVFQINASITAGLCLLTLAVVLARRLKTRS